MDLFGNFGSTSDLASSIGLKNTGNQFWNLTPAELVEDTILQGQGLLSDTGALVRFCSPLCSSGLAETHILGS